MVAHFDVWAARLMHGPHRGRRRPPVQRGQHRPETAERRTPLAVREARPHQVEALPRNPPHRHPRQVARLPGAQDLGMRHGAREGGQQRLLAKQPSAVSASAHPED